MIFRQGLEERRYVVSYQDVITGTRKEKIYSPSLKEIRDIRVHLGMPTASVPAAHSVVSANDNMQTSKIIVNKDVSPPESINHLRSYIFPSHPFSLYFKSLMTTNVIPFGRHQCVWLLKNLMDIEFVLSRGP